MIDLDILEQQLQQQLEAGTDLIIASANLELPALPSFLWPADTGLALAEAVVQRVSVSELQVIGKTRLAVVGDVSLILAVRTGQPSIEAQVGLSDGISLAELMKEIADPLQTVGKLLDAIGVAALEWEIPSHGNVHINLTLKGEYQTQLAGLSLGLVLDQGMIVLGLAGLAAELTGRCNIAEISAPLSAQLQNGKFTTSAQLPNLSLRDLVAKADLPLPQLPGLELLDKALDDLEIIFQNDLPVLSFRYDTAAGPARCIVARHEGEWRIVAGLHADNFRFANLSGALAPLDAFQSIIAFGDPVLSFATAPVTIPYPAAGGGWTERTFEEGFAANGVLKFDGFGLELIKSIFGIDKLPLTLPVGADWSQVHLAATLEKPIKIPGDFAIVDNLTLSLSPGSQLISASGTILVTIAGTELPPFIIGVSLLPGTAEIFVLAKDLWKEPLGIPVTVQELGVQMTTGPSYGVLGKVLLGDKVIAMAVQLTGNVPTMLAGELQGEMALGNILLELADIRLLPSYFQPNIKDFELYIVLHPAGTSVAGRPYPFGLSLKGQLSFMGLGFKSDIHISKTQIRVIGELDDAIRLEPFFRFSGVGKPAPSLMVDTAADPIVALDGAIMFLGLEQSVRAVLGSSGFSTTVSKSLGGAEANLTVQFGNGQLAADGEARCQLVGKVGPLKIPGTGIDLGTINLDTGVELTLHAKAAEGGALDILVKGDFSFAGIQINLPEFKLDIASIEDLPAALFDYVQKNAIALFEELLKDAGAWLKAILEELIEGVENVARAMTDYFQKTAKEAADAMLNVLNNTMETTAKALQDIGKKAEEIAQIFKDLGKTPDDIAGALKAIGVLPDVIGNILKGFNQTADDIRRTLENVGFPPTVVDVVLGPLFPGGDIPQLPPLPFHIKTPHLKHLKAPHLKHLKAPHLKHLKAPHIKF